MNKQIQKEIKASKDVLKIFLNKDVEIVEFNNTLLKPDYSYYEKFKAFETSAKLEELYFSFRRKPNINKIFKDYIKQGVISEQSFKALTGYIKERSKNETK